MLSSVLLMMMVGTAKTSRSSDAYEHETEVLAEDVANLKTGECAKTTITASVDKSTIAKLF